MIDENSAVLIVYQAFASHMQFTYVPSVGGVAFHPSIAANPASSETTNTTGE
jgi:hypothetical protein